MSDKDFVYGPDGNDPLTHPSVVAGLPELTAEEKEALSDSQLYLHSLKTIVKLQEKLASTEAALDAYSARLSRLEAAATEVVKAMGETPVNVTMLTAGIEWLKRELTPADDGEGT